MGGGGGGCIQKDTEMQLDQIQAGRERGRVYKELQKEMNSDHMQVRGGGVEDADGKRQRGTCII